MTSHPVEEKEVLGEETVDWKLYDKLADDYGCLKMVTTSSLSYKSKKINFVHKCVCDSNVLTENQQMALVVCAKKMCKYQIRKILNNRRTLDWKNVGLLYNLFWIKKVLNCGKFSNLQMWQL